jgi:hypothetical protein
MLSLAEASVSHCSIADGHKYGVLEPFVPSLRLAQAQSCMVHGQQSGPNEVEPVSQLLQELQCTERAASFAAAVMVAR